MARDFTLNWRLEDFFSLNGSPCEDKPSLFSLVDAIKADLESFAKTVEFGQFDEMLAFWQWLSAHLREAFTYVACWGLQEPQQFQLTQLRNELIALEKVYGDLCVQMETLFSTLSAPDFEVFVERNQKIASWLRLRRKQQSFKMSLEKELLAYALAKECFYPMQEIYRLSVQRLGIVLPDMGTMDIYTAQKALYEGSIQQRERVLSAYEACWKSQGPFLTSLLNQIYGYRLELMRHRHQNDPLEASLALQRLSKAPLEAMWKAVVERKACFILFLMKKALFFKRKKPIWTDIGGSLLQWQRSQLSLKEASEWMLAVMSRLGQQAHEFSRGMLQHHRVKVVKSDQVFSHQEMRAVALPLPVKKQVLVYLNYGEEMEHLGDYVRAMTSAFRLKLLFELPEAEQQVPSVVAEAFSCFAERLLLEVVSERSTSRQQQFDALYEHMQRALLLVLEGQVHYLFESAVFSERLKGPLTSERLHELMREYQQSVYAGQLSSHFSSDWMTKESFFSTGTHPLQSYAPAMGFLLGLKLYQVYLRQPRGFCERLEQWVRLSASCMDLEALTQQFFQTDLASESTWQEALGVLEQDIRKLGDLIDIKDHTASL